MPVAIYTNKKGTTAGRSLFCANFPNFLVIARTPSVAEGDAAIRNT